MTRIIDNNNHLHPVGAWRESLTVCEKQQLADFVDLFVAHRSQLNHVAAKILGNADRADDVVQDAYMKIIEAEAIFTVREPLPYIFRIVRNLAIDRYRRASLEATFFTSSDEAGYLESTKITPETISIGRQELLMVACALNELPARTRKAFELYRIGGCTQREIAAMLGVSPTLINFMIRDALDHCRAALDPGV